jgi:hypothetical protein
MSRGTKLPRTGLSWCLTLLSTMALTVPLAHAQTGTTEDKALFDRLDVTGNGYLTGNEITPEARAYNTNGDNAISWEEFAAGRARDRAAGKLPGGTAAPPAQPTRPAQPAIPPRTQPQPVATAPVAPAAVQLPALGARPGYVIGRAVFADGRPIPRFQVTALGWAGEVHMGPTGTLPNLGKQTAQNGQYAIRTTSEFDRNKPVRATVLAVQASAMLTRNGSDFFLEMHPTDGKKDGSGEGHFRGDSGKGVVRDFVLRLYGPKRGYEKNTPPRDSSTNEMSDPSFAAFYGGTVAMSLPRDAATTLEGATLTVTFTPRGPLFDGAASRTVVRTLRLRKPDIYTAYFRDIPLGDYTATATVTGANGATAPLRLRRLGGDWGPSLPIVFEPLSSFGVAPFTLLSEH